MSHRRRAHSLIPHQLVFLVGLSCLLVAGASQVGRAVLNLGNVAALAVMEGDTSRAAIASRRLLWAGTSGTGSAYWTLGVLAQQSGNDAARRSYQEHVIETTPERIGLLAQLAADDVELAELAMARWPERAEGFAWRAAQVAKDDPAAAILLYRHSLEIEPKAYEWWLALGRAHEALGQFSEAFAAYDRACTLATGILSCREKQQLEQKMRGS